MIDVPVFILLPIFLATFVLSSCGSGNGGNAQPTTETGPVSPPVVVQPSAATLELIELASQDSAAAQESLLKVLLNRAELAKLNTEQEYLALEPRNLQVFFVLRALAANKTAAARSSLDAVAGDAMYRYAGSFQAVLLEASQYSVDPPSNLLRLWEEQLQPDAGSLHQAVDAVVANGSEKAIKLFEKSLLEQPYREDFVIAWLRDPVLRHRQDAHLLRACERLIKNAKWRKDYRRELVAVLFDYDPKRWYQPETVAPRPPDRKKLSDEARKLLLQIADQAAAEGQLSGRRHSEIREELGQP